MKKYIPAEIEKKWQEKWNEVNLYASHLEEPDKFYVLAEFPYPSGDLHMGHWFTFSGADIYARLKRMQGFNVFFPNGFDAFGLPAENAAIKRNIHPKDWTMSNIEKMHSQFASMGGSFTFDHEVITCLPEYYRWNQWIFLRMLEQNLAYRGKYLSNWCNVCQTVLANEGVEAGACWRCGIEVEQKEVDQWFLKITDYAEKLIWSEKPGVDWPKALREGQNNWIGKSEGALIKFPLKPEDDRNQNEALEVFTTRPDTIFGATFVVISPEHPLLTMLANSKLKTQNSKLEEVMEYVKKAKKKSELERKEDKEKTGVFTGSYVKNPMTGEDIPVWMADYVLMGYGTGAIMAVPAHDQRDFEFAKKYNLPIRPVIIKQAETAKSFLMGGDKITNESIEKIGGKVAETTKEGDRLLEMPNSSVSAYLDIIKEFLTPGFWNEVVGEKVWFVFRHKNGEVTEYILDETTDRTINKLGSEFNSEPPDEKSVWQWLFDNNWYYERLIHNETGTLVNSGEFNGLGVQEAQKKITDYLKKHQTGVKMIYYHLHDWSMSRQRYWGTPIPVVYCQNCGRQPVPDSDLPVELPYDVDYTPKGKPPLASNEEWINTKCPKCSGKALREAETMDTFVDSSWYFFRFLDPKLESAPFDKDLAKKIMPIDVYFGGAEHTLGHTLYARFFTKFLHDLGLTDLEEFAKRRINHGIVLGPDGNKMSKSKGNVVNPDEEVKRYGADTVRVYLAFSIPYETTGPWVPERVWGPYRFLERVWNLFDKIDVRNSDSDSDSDSPSAPEDLYIMHKTIKKVGEDIEAIKYNTAIAALMEWLNFLSRKDRVSYEEYKNLLILLSPFAPHMTEELWGLVNGESMSVIASEAKQSRTEEGIASSETPRNDKRWSIHQQSWPQYDEKYLEEEEVTVVIQVNGKVRDNLVIQKDIENIKEVVEKMAKMSPKVQKFLEGRKILKTVYIPVKIINFVLSQDK